MTVLCAICAEHEPAPVICRRCEDRIRRDLDNIGRDRRRLHDWEQIDPGTPCRDDTHRLALLDNPILTQSGQPDLAVIAATDRRTRRIPSDDGAGWHPDDVVNVDWELITEARLIADQRHLAAPIASVHDAIRILVMSRDWTARSDRVDEHAAIMANCAAALRGILHDVGDRIIGLCPAAHPERDTCGGPLRPAWLGPLPLVVEDQVKPTHVMCDWCQDPWPLDAATLVGMLRVVQVRRFPVPRQWVCQQFPQVTPLRLARWVHRGRVRAYERDVDLVDILAQLADTPQVTSA